MIGEQISHYRILSELGSGGMGVVWLAEDVALNRRVALKFIRPDLVRDAQADERLLREARAASALDHPNVATIYEVGEWQGRHFIAMAWYDGETLSDRIARGSVPIEEVLRLLQQIADGLAKAHTAGIVHRDLKPGNVIVTREGIAKILDFGLAAFTSPDAATQAQLTTAGTTMGTLAYMSPEQAMGERVDARTDIWSLGVIAYELLAGRRPFRGPQPAAVLHAIQYDAPDLTALDAAAPAPLRQAIAKALEKQPGERLATVDDFSAYLRESRALLSAAGVAVPSRPGLFRRPLVIIPLVLALLAVGALAIGTLTKQQRTRWARNVALPEVQRLVEQERIVEAFDLAMQAQEAAPADPVLADLVSTLVRTPPIRSEPPGATVSYKDYGTPDAPWRPIGTTPIKGVRLPATFLRWRFEKPGFALVESALLLGTVTAVPESTEINVTLTPASEAPPGMVLVPADSRPFQLNFPGFEHLGELGAMDAFWIDRLEVTNADFKKFVDAGGYRRQEYWQEPFQEAGRNIPWGTAVARFVDSTGRPGPGFWVQGEPPAGEGDLPVTGVSWYEASAYARFAGKVLPTVHHWARAAEPRNARWIVPFSNFGGRGPLAGKDRPTLHVSGAFDMAGNVKEWVSTDVTDGRRYILGGAWDDPVYAFNDPDARAPFDRARTFGFRCAIYPRPPAARLLAALPSSIRDYGRERPAMDAEYQIYKRLYAYDRHPFTAKVEAMNSSAPDWRYEIVTVPAASGREQMRVLMILPRRGTPPYPVVVVFPGANALRTREFSQFPTAPYDYLVKSGRAVALPEYKGTFGRETSIKDSTATPTVAYRDHMIAWVQDFRRAVDYLATRPDVSIDRLAMVGYSWGAKMGAIIPAIEDRVKAQVLVVGGFAMQRPLPEVDQINFAQHVTIPTLMLNGKYDFYFPVDKSQLPMFEALGTPKELKVHQTYDGGHNVPRTTLIKLTLDWLDRFQPVPQASGR